MPPPKAAGELLTQWPHRGMPKFHAARQLETLQGFRVSILGRTAMQEQGFPEKLRELTLEGISASLKEEKDTPGKLHRHVILDM